MSATTNPRANVCDLCDGIGHTRDTCETAHGGSSVLMQRAIDLFAEVSGEKYRVKASFADAIGMADAGLSKILHTPRELSQAKRLILVTFLRTHRLPEVPPERRAGTPAKPVLDPTVDDRAMRRVRLAKRDKYALLLLGKRDRAGHAGVIRDALDAWVINHPTPPTFPLIDADEVMGSEVGEDIIARFDVAIGGADHRMKFFPTAIAEWVRRDEFRPFVKRTLPDLDADIERAASAPRSVLCNEYSGARPSAQLARALDIIKVMSADKLPIKTATVGDAMGLGLNSAQQVMGGLVASEHIHRIGDGLYQLADPQPLTSPMRAKTVRARKAEAAANAKRKRTP